MPAIVWPTSTSPGYRAVEGGGRLVNCYAAPLTDGAPAPIVIRRTTGLTRWVTTAQTGYRGGFYDGGAYAYAAFNGVLRKFDSAGVESAVGALAGTDPCFFARNQRTPTPDQLVVCNAGTFAFTPTTITPLATPTAFNSICFLDGYFFGSVGDGRVYASGINATTWNTSDVIRAEAKPDGVVRVIAFSGELWVCGVDNIEVWAAGGSPNLTGFPLRRSTVIDRGLINNTAVSGFEASFESTLVLVSNDNTVRLFEGYTPRVVSTPDLNRLLDRVADKTTISAYCYVKYGLSRIIVTARGQFSWVIDPLSQTWYERQSYLRNDCRFQGETFYAFGKWIGGDVINTGDLIFPSEETQREIDQPLILDVSSAVGQGFPQRVHVARADFQFVTGQGIVNGEDPVERNPQCEIMWSDDGGNTWSTPLLRRLGASGQYGDITIKVHGLGVSGVKGRRWRIRISDPVYAGLLAGDMTVSPYAS
jgi:hypothetical protein